MEPCDDGSGQEKNDDVQDGLEGGKKETDEDC